VIVFRVQIFALPWLWLKLPVTNMPRWQARLTLSVNAAHAGAAGNLGNGDGPAQGFSDDFARFPGKITG
jgi:hypothetical protein